MDPLPLPFDAACFVPFDSAQGDRYGAQGDRYGVQGDFRWEVDQKISSEDQIWLEIHDDVMETAIVDVMISNETIQIDAFTIDLTLAQGWAFTDCMEGDSGAIWFEFECRQVSFDRITVAAYTIPTVPEAVVGEGAYCSLVRMVFESPYSHRAGTETPVEIIGIYDDLGCFLKNDSVRLD